MVFVKLKKLGGENWLNQCGEDLCALSNGVNSAFIHFGTYCSDYFIGGVEDNAMILSWLEEEASARKATPSNHIGNDLTPRNHVTVSVFDTEVPFENSTLTQHVLVVEVVPQPLPVFWCSTCYKLQGTSSVTMSTN